MLPESVIGRLVKQPTEMAASIKEATQWYKDNVLQKVEDFMAAWDRQKLIELDANQTESEIFRVKGISVDFVCLLGKCC